MKTADIMTYEDIFYDDDFDIQNCTYAVGPSGAIRSADFGKIKQAIALKFGKYQITHGECGPMLVESPYWNARSSLVVAVQSPYPCWREDAPPTWVVSTKEPSQVLMPWKQYLDIRKAVNEDRRKHERAKQAVAKERAALRAQIVGLMGLPAGTLLTRHTFYRGGRDPVNEWRITLEGAQVGQLVRGLPAKKGAAVDRLMRELREIKDPTC